jgi:hypothetical protein
MESCQHDSYLAHSRHSINLSSYLSRLVNLNLPSRSIITCSRSFGEPRPKDDDDGDANRT